MNRIIDIISVASEHLGEKGFENARLEVEQMLGSVLGLSRIDLYMAFDRPLTDDELDRFRSMYRRRLAHEPLQYVIGSTGFRELDVKTDRRALIPRPETELLVELAVKHLRDCASPLVADIGTGSGIIALSVAYEVDGVRVVAVDISDEALRLAGQNAVQAGVEDRIRFVRGNMLEGLEGEGPFDAILSNPPYVRSGDIDRLQPEISRYEPRIALDGGGNGMDCLMVIARNAHRYMKTGGLLLLECSHDQADQVAGELESCGHYSGVDSATDLAGKKRVVRAFFVR